MASSPTHAQGQGGPPPPPPQPVHTIGVPPPPENMYRWKFGTTPIWANPAFIDIFFDAVVTDMSGPSFTSSASGHPSVPKDTPEQRAGQLAQTTKPPPAAASPGGAAAPPTPEGSSLPPTLADGSPAPIPKRAPMTNGAFTIALDLMMNVFQGIVSANAGWLAGLTPEEMTHFTLTLPTLAEAKMYSAKSLHVGSRNDQTLFDMLKELHQRVAMLSYGGMILVPAGWVNDKGLGHNVMFAIHRGQVSFCLAIINTSADVNDGLRYHPMNPLASPDIQYKQTLIFDDIPIPKLMDSSWWLMILRMQVYPSAENTPELLYETFLPYLNGKPLTATIADNVDEKRPEGAMAWSIPAKSGDASLFHNCMESAQFLLRRKNFSPNKVGLLAVLIQWQMVRMMYDDMGQLTHLTSNDSRLFTLACQHLARSASIQAQKPGGGGFTADLLRQVQAFIESVHTKIATMTKQSIMFQGQVELKDPKDKDKQERSGASDDGLLCKWQALPLFDRFVRAEGVEALAGPAEIVPMFRPIQFTHVPEVCESVDDVMIALRHCDHLCTLLSYQTETIKNTYMLRVAMIQHVFTQVIPIPMPINHPDRAHLDLWAQPMKYETQVELMRVIRLISRHYAACAMSLKITRSFDAARILVNACMAAMVDTLVRVRAVDVPSMLSLHMQGQAPLTPRFFFQPFGVDMGPFAKQSEYMKFTTPELVACRTCVLDYFHAQQALIKDDHMIFKFDRTMEPGNIMRLLEQLAWEIGFPVSNMPAYLSGEKREVLLNYPELVYYRDVVFMFKFLMTPTNSALPEIRTWIQTDADLQWKYNQEKNEYEVRAFDQILSCAPPVDPEEEAKKRETESKGFFSRIWGLFSKDSRAGPSGADPSALAGEHVDNEEDVLHVKDMPSFNGKLSASAAELLISYLTAPYLRIPLILNFFASPEHIHALGQERLQTVVDGALFEPGLWQSATTEKTIPMAVPTSDRTLFATPAGLLFNELQKSPQGLMRALSDLLEFAIELDSGRFSSGTAPIILYVCRLIVRVEAFMLYIINHNRGQSMTGSAWHSQVRGLELSPKQLKMLSDKRKQIRTLINDQVFPMLDRWCEHAIKADEIGKSCILHAHLAFLFFHLPSNELNRNIVATILAAQIFLTTRYRYDLAAENGLTYQRMAKDKEQKDNVPESGLMIPDTEMFDLFQQQRPKILNFLNKDFSECNEVMEAIVRVVTMTGTRVKSASEEGGAGPTVKIRYWRSMDGMDCVGRFIPDMKPRSIEDQLRIERERAFKRGEQLVETEINIQLGSLTLNTSRLEVLDAKIIGMQDFKDVFGATGTQMQCAPVKITTNRQWVRLVGTRHDVQYWKPDDRTPRLFPFTRPYIPDMLSPTERWISRIIQRILPTHRLLRHVDQLFLPTNPYNDSDAWAQLAGYQISLPQRPKASPELKPPDWKEGTNCYTCQTPFSFSFRQHHCRFCGKSFCAPCTSKLAKIPEYGYNEPVRVCDPCYIKLNEFKTLKEVVVFRKQQVVHIYNVVEYGRRWYRSLVWSSDSRFTLNDLPPIWSPDASWMQPDRYAITDGKKHADASYPHPSLIITRNFTTLADKMQVYVPSRFLKGLIPDGLLDEYTFWQETDDSLTGYMKKEIVAKRSTVHVLRIELIRDERDGATAKVVRIPKKKYDEMNDVEVRNLERAAATARGETLRDVDAEMEVKEKEKARERDEQKSKESLESERRAELAEKNRKMNAASEVLFQLQEETEEDGEYTLLPILYAEENTTLAQVADFFVRMEDLSFVLVWTKGRVTDDASMCSVDLIELPRLQMSFYSKRDLDGKVRIYSKDHFGYFISSSLRDNMIMKILEGLPHGLVLENLDGDVAVLVPATLPRRLKHFGESFSTEIMLMRRDKQWLNNMKVRQYLYPVHLSMTFLFTPTLSSALYLLLLRFLNRQYNEVFALSDSCVSDTRLSGEEEQILAQLKYVQDDISPDSHACRLKLHLIMSDSSMPALPWDIRVEMNDYLKKRSNITSVCRLSALEEHTLLCLCQEGENPQIFNRFHYLGAFLNSQAQSPVLLPPAVITQDGQAGLLWPGRATWDGVVDQRSAQQTNGVVEAKGRSASSTTSQRRDLSERFLLYCCVVL